MYIIKDLVPDMNNFYTQYRSIKPWLQKKKSNRSGSEQYLQSIEDRQKLVSIVHIILAKSTVTGQLVVHGRPDCLLQP